MYKYIIFLFIVFSFTESINLRTRLTPVSSSPEDHFISVKTINSLSNKHIAPLSGDSIHPATLTTVPSPHNTCVPRHCLALELPRGFCPCIKGLKYESEHVEPQYKPEPIPTEKMVCTSINGCPPQLMSEKKVKQLVYANNHFEPSYKPECVENPQLVGCAMYLGLHPIHERLPIVAHFRGETNHEIIYKEQEHPVHILDLLHHINEHHLNGMQLLEEDDEDVKITPDDYQDDDDTDEKLPQQPPAPADDDDNKKEDENEKNPPKPTPPPPPPAPADDDDDNKKEDENPPRPSPPPPAPADDDDMDEKLPQQPPAPADDDDDNKKEDENEKNPPPPAPTDDEPTPSPPPKPSPRKPSPPSPPPPPSPEDDEEPTPASPPTTDEKQEKKQEQLNKKKSVHPTTPNQDNLPDEPKEPEPREAEPEPIEPENDAEKENAKHPDETDYSAEEDDEKKTPTFLQKDIDAENTEYMLTKEDLDAENEEKEKNGELPEPPINDEPIDEKKVDSFY